MNQPVIFRVFLKDFFDDEVVEMQFTINSLHL